MLPISLVVARRAKVNGRISPASPLLCLPQAPSSGATASHTPDVPAHSASHATASVRASALPAAASGERGSPRGGGGAAASTPSLPRPCNHTLDPPTQQSAGGLKWRRKCPICGWTPPVVRAAKVAVEAPETCTQTKLAVSPFPDPLPPQREHAPGQARDSSRVSTGSILSLSHSTNSSRSPHQVHAVQPVQSSPVSGDDCAPSSIHTDDIVGPANNPAPHDSMYGNTWGDSGNSCNESEAHIGETGLASGNGTTHSFGKRSRTSLSSSSSGATIIDDPRSGLLYANSADSTLPAPLPHSIVGAPSQAISESSAGEVGSSVLPIAVLVSTVCTPHGPKSGIARAERVKRYARVISESDSPSPTVTGGVGEQSCACVEVAGELSLSCSEGALSDAEGLFSEESNTDDEAGDSSSPSPSSRSSVVSDSDFTSVDSDVDAHAHDDRLFARSVVQELDKAVQGRGSHLAGTGTRKAVAKRPRSLRPSTGKPRSSHSHTGSRKHTRDSAGQRKSTAAARPPRQPATKSCAPVSGHVSVSDDSDSGRVQCAPPSNLVPVPACTTDRQRLISALLASASPAASPQTPQGRSRRAFFPERSSSVDPPSSSGQRHHHGHGTSGKVPPIPPSARPHGLAQAGAVSVDTSEAGSEEEERFTCQICVLSYATVRGLQRHMRVHTGERPFACAHCPQTFIRKDYMLRHMAREHPLPA